MTKERESIVLTGYTYVIGALADLYPSRELKSTSRVAKGDMKLWCHMAKVAHAVGSVAAGQFRAAIFDGKKWRTFRLNFVADSEARYGSYDERTRKARRVYDAIAGVKGYTAHLHQSGSFGVVTTLKAENAGSKGFVAPQATPVAGAGRAETTPAATPVRVPPAPEVAVARSFISPGIAVTVVTTVTVEQRPFVAPAARRGRRRMVDERQLTLF